MITPENASNEDSHGDPTAEDRGKRVQTLPAIGAFREPPCCDAMGMSSACVDRSQEHVVKLEHFDRCREELTKRPTTTPKLHRMKLSTIREQAANQIVEVSDLSTPVADLAGIENRMAALRELRTGEESRHREPVEQVAQECVNQVFDQILTEFRELSESSPFSIVGEVDRCLEHLGRQSKYVATADSGETRLRNLRDGIHAVGASDQIPDHKRSILVKTMVARTSSAVTDTLEELARLEAEKAFWKSVARFKNDLLGLRERGVSLQARLQEVRQRLSEAQKTEANSIAEVSAGMCIMLDGPDRNEVQKLLANRFEQGGGGIVTAILEQMVGKLTIEDDSERRALASSTSVQILAAFNEVVAEALASYTIYSASTKYGVIRLIDDLYKKARPMVHLERLGVQQGVELLRINVLRVAHAKTHADQAVLEQIKNRIKSIAPNTKVEQAAEGSQLLEATRILSGFHPSTMGDGRVCLTEYAKTRDNGHPVHAVPGLIPDAADGLASPIAKMIVERLDKEDQL